MALWGCTMGYEARSAASGVHHFHLTEGYRGVLGWGRRVGSTGSNGPKVSESVRRSLGGLTWLPWFSPASGACRAPDDGLGIRASVSGGERANGAVDEPCRSRCVQNSHDVVTVTFSLGLLRSMASPTSTNSLSVRQSLDWPLWSGHFPTSFAGRKGSSGLLAGCAEAGAV